MEEALDYRTWPADKLVARVAELESKLKSLTLESSGPVSDTSSQSGSLKRRAKKAKKDGSSTFDCTKYSTRFIALKFAYLGQRYNGLEYVANNPTPLPTVEEELWKALHKTRLIFPTGEAAERGEISWEGCEYSKCGRTDRGVSAFGQVVALRVRSARPVPGRQSRRKVTEEDAVSGEDVQTSTQEPETEEDFDPVRDELPYIQLLNRVLPYDIRILAWCPNPPPDFSARFSCEERRYRYFFTNPGFAPVPGERGIMQTVSGKPLREGWLDIAAMQDAAKRLEGLHDFRNFCKIDPTKQISNHERRIYHASIEEVDLRQSPVGYVGWPQCSSDGSVLSTKGDFIQIDGDIQTPKLYTFNVNGSAFLWHQVRNMVAVLFLVGQGLELPSVVTDLLDAEKTPTRPKYEMASDAPLVLWDCIFPKKRGAEREDALTWVRAGDEGGRDTNKLADVEGGDGKFGRNGIMDSLWTTWRQRKIDEVLAGSLVDLVASQGRQTSLSPAHDAASRHSTRIFEGSSSARAIGKYVPIMQKDRMEHFSIINARYQAKKDIKQKTATESQSVES